MKRKTQNQSESFCLMSLRQRTADKNLNLYSESLAELSNGSPGTCLIYFFKLCVLPLSFHDLVHCYSSLNPSIMMLNDVV